MERNREARRGTVAAAAVNGGLSRRRQRTSSLRDSPEEDGGMEMAETTRLRDRGSKKDRDRDRSNRSKRRRGERMLHGSNREEGDDSSEESVDEEEEEDVSAAVRLPPPPPLPNPASLSSSLPQSNQQQQNRKSFPTKLTRSPPVWKADEMIGFSVPRKARSASTKRSHDCGISGGSGSGEQIHRQASTSPSRLSPASTTQISPSSSNASARKKMKPMSGSKHRPAKVSKSPSLIQEDIEIEVAEVLYGMTRQFQCPSKQESQKLDSKDMNGGSGSDSKSRVSSPNTISSPPAASHASVLPPSNYSSNPTSLSAIAPKRKKPRPIKFEDESPTSPIGLVALPSTSVSPSANLESDQPMKTEVSSPRSEKNTAFPAIETGSGSGDISVAQVVAAVAALDVHQYSAKMENNSVPDPELLDAERDDQNRMENPKEAASPAKEASCADLAFNRGEETAKNADPVGDGSREEKFGIDLMVPATERDELGDFDADHRSQVSGTEMVSKVNIVKEEEEKTVERATQANESLVEAEESNSRKNMGKERTIDLQIDFEKSDKDSLDGGRFPFQKQQSKVHKSEPKPEKPAASTSLPTPMTVAGWPGSFPPFGCMGQVPSMQAIIPMDGKPGSSSILQPPSFLSQQPRPKRCATHCYVAQNIYYHQRLARMNPFWPAGGGGTTPPVQGAKPCNLNAVPPSDGFGGGFPGGRNVGSLQGNKGAATVSPPTGLSSKERMPSTNNTTVDTAQRKQVAHQQPPHSGSAASALPVPAFIFPLNQQQAAAAAMAAAATLSGAAKSGPGLSNGAPSSGASTSVVMGAGTGGQAAPMNLSFASLPPNEAQYLAILQNNAYPFPIPAHVAGAPPFRGASPCQPMPFFYPSQMLHPPQLQQQQLPGPQPPPHGLQGHPKPSSSGGSSSSQKHPQQSQLALGGAPGGGGNSLGFPPTNQRQLLLPHQVRQLESDRGLQDSPSTADSRTASQTQKNIYGNNFAVPMYSQNFTLMSNAAATAPSGSGGGQTDKQPLHHHHQQQPRRNQAVKVELPSSQAFAMPFAFSGAGATQPGLDFSSMAQNHALFQSFPDAARHGYHHFATAAPPPQAVQQNKALADGRPAAGDLMSATVVAEAERKIKAQASGSQHSLSFFSKPDSEPPISSIIGNSAIDISPRTLNLISAASNAGQTTNRSGCATTTVNLLNSQPQHLQQQHEQQLIQLQNLHLQHQQQHLTPTHTKSSTSGGNNSPSVYSERLPGGSTATKYPQTLPPFPQSLIQGGSPTQSPQWKATNARAAATPSPAQSLAKNGHLRQQQGRVSQQQPLPNPGHQTQISFTMNSMKTVSAGGQHHSGVSSNPSPSGSAAVAVGSPSNSASKSAGSSPRASASSKPKNSVPLPQQSSAKSSMSGSSCKSSLTQNVPSILGHPHIASAPSSGSKQPQQPLQHPQQLPRSYPFPNAQLMFSNACPLLQPQSPQSNAAAAAAAAAGYYQRRPSEQHLQQQHHHHHHPSSTPGSTGMLAPLPPSALMLAGASATNDPLKAVAAAAAAANSMKGLAPPALMHAAHLAAAPHHLIPGSFPYNMIPPVSMKPAADQKHAAGNDSLHACWRPEKR